MITTTYILLSNWEFQFRLHKLWLLINLFLNKSDLNADSLLIIQMAKLFLLLLILLSTTINFILLNCINQFYQFIFFKIESDHSISSNQFYQFAKLNMRIKSFKPEQKSSLQCRSLLPHATYASCHIRPQLILSFYRHRTWRNLIFWKAVSRPFYLLLILRRPKSSWWPINGSAIKQSSSRHQSTFIAKLSELIT